jgi:hypothetical protein
MPPDAVDIDLKKVYSYQPDRNIYHTFYFREGRPPSSSLTACK